jgi:hypothetical protein
MIDFCAGVMARQGLMPESEARLLLIETLPRLKRWRALQEVAAAAPQEFKPGDEQC